MRPFESFASSIARSTAQSECCALSTGTKTSVYTGPPAERRRVALAETGPVCFRAPGRSTVRARRGRVERLVFEQAAEGRLARERRAEPVGRERRDREHDR